MQKVTKNVDALGFDKWQIADVRRAYQSNKATYTKMNRIAEKVQKLSDEYNAQKAQLEAWEGPVKLITNKVLGIDLTSQEVLAFHKNPSLFLTSYPDHPQCEAIKEFLATHPVSEEEAETEAPEEQNFESGELQQAETEEVENPVEEVAF